VWTIQGAWVTLTAISVFVVNSYGATDDKPINGVDVLGYIVWVVGFGIEVTADNQKSNFAANPNNKGKVRETAERERERERERNNKGRLIIRHHPSCTLTHARPRSGSMRVFGTTPATPTTLVRCPSGWDSSLLPPPPCRELSGLV
jgi:hypothetical protein